MNPITPNTIKNITLGNMTGVSFDIESPTASINTFDWRLDLFGPIIESNQKTDAEALLLSTEQALSPDTYDYVAVLFTADYCRFCKEFVPKLIASHSYLLDKRCKVIVSSNDRSEEAFENTRQKVRGIDMLPYDTARTGRMRDLFGLKTIPALVVLKNAHFDLKSPAVETTDARNAIVADPSAVKFPWPQDERHHDSTPKYGMDQSKFGANGAAPMGKMSNWDRFIISGTYGRWYNLGHKSNPDRPDQMYMDEHAVRIRAGLLNIVTWIAIMNIFFWKLPNSIYCKIVFPIIGWEFVASGLFGLTPLAPIGTISSALAIVLHPEPHWKPAGPKRFAWAIGLVLASSCFTFSQLRGSFGDEFPWILGGIAITCNFFTWMESACGFCFGCFVYNKYVVPMIGLEECSECKL